MATPTIDTPGKARSLWHWFMTEAATDRRAQTILDDIIRSAVIDIITKKMAGDDEYALVIGRRIQALDEAVPAPYVVPERYCDKCGLPLDNLQGEYLMGNGYGKLATICHRCYPAMLTGGFQVVAMAK